MGASVATILQSLARRDGIMKTKCYAFSPPPSVTLKINEQLLSSDCYSFIIEDDIVPSCSRHAIKTFVQRVKLFKEKKRFSL